MGVPFIGQIEMFGGNFPPRGWQFCNGQLLAISSNTALFSIIGTIYGGDGETTFALPDLRGRAAIQAGNGPALTPRRMGEKGGSEANSITEQALPAHTHDVAIAADSAQGTRRTVADGTTWAGASEDNYGPGGPGSVAMKSAVSEVKGQGVPVDNMQPWLGCQFIICVQGIYPST